eukprot:1142424-Pelagomonas_calceolata.AAC.4
MRYNITLLTLFGLLELRILSLVIALACWAVAASIVGKGLVSGQIKSNKVNVPILRRDLCRIKVGGSAWDRAHKDSIRAA